MFWLTCLCLTLVISEILAGQYSNPTCDTGRHTIVSLFEWKWTDIAEECENFLGPRGFCGVQISPPTENRVITSPHNRPWYERYQPVSYKLYTRSGSESEFIDMVERCNKVHVRIYVVAVINHMAGTDGAGVGTAGSKWDGHKMSFPAVPYSVIDFHDNTDCHTSDLNIQNYNDTNQMRNCRLLVLSDLKYSRDYVKEKVAAYMNKLINIGVGGFYIDAAQHMWPGELASLFSRLHNLNTTYFPTGKRPFMLQEVVVPEVEPSDYFRTGRTTNFFYGQELADIILKHNKTKNLKTFGQQWGISNSDNYVVFTDTHDDQRGQWSKGNETGVLTFHNPYTYKIGNAFMLAYPYGFARLMSSYKWKRNIVNGLDNNGWYGPPHHADMTTKNVTIKDDQSCGNGWVCEHRWHTIYNMVAFRNVVTGTTLTNWWDNGRYQIAFGRGNKGFFVLNQQGNLNQTLQTGLSHGIYCDVISGDYKNNTCTGENITVADDGTAHFHIGNGNNNPMIAIHIGAKVGSAKKVTT